MINMGRGRTEMYNKTIGQVMCLEKEERMLKGTVSRDFRQFFWLKRFDLGPLLRGKNGFAKFFVYSEIFARKALKSGVRVVKDYTDTRFFLLMRIFSYF